MTFPSVTVCNENRVHCENLNNYLTKLYCNADNFDYYWDDPLDCSNIPKIEIPSKNVIDALIELHTITHCDLPEGYYYMDEEIVDQMVASIWSTKEAEKERKKEY